MKIYPQCNVNSMNDEGVSSSAKSAIGGPPMSKRDKSENLLKKEAFLNFLYITYRLINAHFMSRVKCDKINVRVVNFDASNSRGP